jgi:hemolysin activation/secretion protein
LPQTSDIRYDQYGIGFRVSEYDYFLNPRKGYGIEFSGGVGIKQIIENSTIKDIVLYGNSGETYSVYDSTKMQYVQYKFSLNADVFIPVAKRATFRTQVNGAHIQAENIFFNELYRIGGIRTLKGFDEQSIFASSYIIINTELRYLLQQNSNFIFFWNGAWYRNVAVTPVKSDKPFGFGAGLNFETGAGVFSIFYAVGKQFNNTIEFDKAKIHFGFVNYF